MQQLFTLGLPIYNSMPYLKEAVESVLAQTYPHFKILAVADDCQDGSIEYIESICDPRLRVIRQPKSGLAAALNRMLREAETPWLVRQDTDDVSYPNRIERLMLEAERHPNAGMFYSPADYYPKDQCVGQFRCSKGDPSELRAIVESGYLLSFCHTSVALKREAALSIGGYREDLLVEDADMWWRMALASDIQFIPEALVGFRHNPNQSSSRTPRRQEVHGLYIQYLLLSRLWNRQPRSVSEVEPLLESFVSSRDLEAKTHLQRVNIRLSERKYGAAIGSAAKCLAASPKFLLKRLRDEFSPPAQIANGVDPRLYLKREKEFWR